MPDNLHISLDLPNSLGCQKFDSQFEDARTSTLACLWSFSGLTLVPGDEWCNGNQQPHGWQLTQHLLTTYPALTVDESPDADQRKKQGDRDHGDGRGQNICGRQNETEIQGIALAHWSTVKAKTTTTNKQTNKQMQKRNQGTHILNLLSHSVSSSRVGEQLE